MSKIYEAAFFEDSIIAFESAQVSIASSAVLYGLSIYTVFPVVVTKKGRAAFRLSDHFERLMQSAHIIGLTTFEQEWTFKQFEKAVKELIAANDITEDVFVRASVHVTDLVPGTRAKGLTTTLSMFVYEAKPIIPQDGARLKTSVWRRIPDHVIPSRAKVNGAYVNSVLGKQDALDAGYDDCIFLDAEGHVCELSAANIFLVRNGVLITPSTASDILEGINRRTVVEIARDAKFPVEERVVDLTELYVASEVFACGTSSFLAPVKEIDGRSIPQGPMTQKLGIALSNAIHGKTQKYRHFLTNL